jgi:hypothetical protein
MSMYRHQNAGQDHDTKLANRSSENVREITVFFINRGSPNLLEFSVDATVLFNYFGRVMVF